MATDDPRRILRVPGRLSWGATDLTAVWPHGGTGLGAVKGVRLQRIGAAYPLTMEAKGGIPVEYNEEGPAWLLAATIRTFEDDAIQRVFRNTAAGTTSQRRVVTEPGTVRAGNWLSGRSGVLVFTPEGATQAKSATAPDTDAPFVVLYRVLPLLKSDVAIPLELGEPFEIDVVFQAIPDSSDRLLAMGPRNDLSFP